MDFLVFLIVALLTSTIGPFGDFLTSFFDGLAGLLEGLFG